MCKINSFESKQTRTNNHRMVESLILSSMFQPVGNQTFTVDADGRAVLLIQATDVALAGDNNVMGRSVVIECQSESFTICGVIAQT